MLGGCGGCGGVVVGGWGFQVSWWLPSKCSCQIGLIASEFWDISIFLVAPVEMLVSK